MKAYGEVAGAASGLLIAARIEAGLSQRQLAERAGTSAATLAAYESGRREPRLSTLTRILDAAGYELRLRYEPIDGSQQALKDWEESLPPEVIGPWRKRHADRVEADLVAAQDALRTMGG